MKAFISTNDSFPILPAIVVVIAYADGRSPSQSLKASLLGDVGKCAVAIVSIESISGSTRSRHASSAKDKYVNPAVLVVIEKCASTADRFRDAVFVIDFSKCGDL